MAHVSLFRILYYTWFASEVIVAVATRTRGRQGDVRDRGSMLLLWIVIAAAITAGKWVGAVVSAPLFGGASWLSSAALLVLLAGLIIRWTAIFTLGKWFSANVAIREDQQLKQSGLYRFVRHPSYSGLLLILLAIGLHTRNWAGLLVLFVPAAAALVYRIHIEEAALSEAFGERYAAYRRATWRLAPGLY
jgi:protein-S-isoprenylcysteine O-methyltransferase Ste14